MKVSIHPLFFIFGLYFALTGKVFLFLTFTLSALVHEMGHAVMAERLGYGLNRIKLMPYGAVCQCEIGGISYKDEILVAIYGPLFNIFVCVIFTCFWWLAPESYPYLESVVFTNLCIFFINLLPAYPLDGGRILSATLSLALPRKKSVAITKGIGVAFALAILALFVYGTTIGKVNLSVLFFGLFALFGALSSTKENAYVRILYNQNLFSAGVKECAHLIAPSRATLKELIAKTQGKRVFTLTVCYPNQTTKNLDLEQTKRLLGSARLYDEIGNLVNDCLN